MHPSRQTSGVPALVLVLVALLICSGCAPTSPTPDGEAVPWWEDRRLVWSTSREEEKREGTGGKTLSASIPARDVWGEPVPGLPRYPGSVRTGYSEDFAGDLALVRAEYLTKKGPEAVRGFYRDAFHAGDWRVANVEYSAGDWNFLVLRGDREAEVVIEPRGVGSEVGIELSVPAAVCQEARPSAGGSKR